MSMSDSARKIPGVAAAEDAILGVTATEEDLPIKDYDTQSAEDIASKLKGFSQRDLRTIAAYERKRENRVTILDRIRKLTADEPWSGYDDQTVEQVADALYATDSETAKRVRAYERDHKDRTSVLDAADRRLAR